MTAEPSAALSYHPLHGTHDPTEATPRRLPGSVRRTSSVDLLRPDGLSGDLRMTGSARDLVTAADGSADVVAEAALDATVDFVPHRTVTRLSTRPHHRGAGRLVGLPAASGFRAVVEEAFADHREARTPLYLLLDDIPVAALISGHALGAGGLVTRKLSLLVSQRPNLCSGWREGGTIMNDVRSQGRPPVVTGPPAPDIVTGDPLAWHAMAALPPTGMRRQRRLDVRREGGGLVVDAMFRDTYVLESGVPTIIHEYVVNGLIDPVAGMFTEITATPHVLPWVECPHAAASAGDVVGRPLNMLRRYVRDQITGVPSCTHLNDLLRSLEDVLGLLPHLPADA